MGAIGLIVPCESGTTGMTVEEALPRLRELREEPPEQIGRRSASPGLCEGRKSRERMGARKPGIPSVMA